MECKCKIFVVLDKRLEEMENFLLKVGNEVNRSKLGIKEICEEVVGVKKI